MKSSQTAAAVRDQLRGQHMKAFIPRKSSGLRIDHQRRRDGPGHCHQGPPFGRRARVACGMRDHGQGNLRIVWNILALVAAAVAILYVFDYVSAKYAIPGNRQVYADVTIDQYWAVKEKGNKIEYSPADPVVERCVYSVFPHFGYAPCWYLTRHTRRAIEVGAMPGVFRAGSALRLAGGENGGVVDVIGGGPAGKIVHGFPKTLQDRPDGNGAAQPLRDFLTDIPG
jgi:hypothetical protein